MNAPETISLRSPARRRERAWLWLLPTGLLLACGLALSARTSSRLEPRTLTLTAHDMAFYVEGDPTPNPVLRVRRGEALRLTLVNRDLGMTHDLAIESLDVATRSLREVGATASVEFEAPDRPGETEYVCTFHDKMMRGVLRIE
jgi:hypothetical protein